VKQEEDYTMENSSGFFQSLFDFSFSYFITSKIIKLLYALSICFAGITALSMIIGGFTSSFLTGLLTLLIAAPVVFLLMVIYSRVILEIIMVIFRIAEDAHEIAQQGKV
jgi:hypothetical protein